MPNLKGCFQTAWKAWDEFFFAPTDLYNVSLFRMIFGLSILGLYLLRFKGFDVFYLDSGLMPYEWAQQALPDDYRTVFPFFVSDDGWMKLHGYAHLFMVALFALGIVGRESTWFLFLLQLGLMQRNMTVAYGADLFSLFWLFYLSFVDHNRYFSLWNVIRDKLGIAFGRRRDANDRPGDAASTFGIRLLQIQLCLAYAYTGIEKLKGIQWWEGTAVWYVIGIEELVPHDFTFLQNFPITVAMLTQLTVIFEIYFIFAVWTRLRSPWLIFGLLFHLGTALFMGLWFFCLVMVTPYLLFLRGRVTIAGIKRAIGLIGARSV